jgi:hypothetical protein
VVKDLGSNWADVASSAPAGQENGVQLNDRWLAGNGLVNAPPSGLQHQIILKNGAGAMHFKGKLSVPNQQPTAPQVAQGRANAALQEESIQQAQAGKPRGGRGEEQEALQQFQTNLALQVQQQAEKALKQSGDKQQAAEGAFEYTEAHRAQPTPSQSSTGGFGRPWSGETKAYPVADLVTPVPAGLASLDFQLPQSGTIYRFTTTRGEVQITARAVSQELLSRLAALACIAAVVLVVWCGLRLVRRSWLAWLARPLGIALLIILGLVSVLIGVWPIAGLLIGSAGLVLAVRAIIQRKSTGGASGTQPEKPLEASS